MLLKGEVLKKYDIINNKYEYVEELFLLDNAEYYIKDDVITCDEVNFITNEIDLLDYYEGSYADEDVKTITKQEVENLIFKYSITKWDDSYNLSDIIFYLEKEN